MTRVEIDGETYACPFASLFRPLTEAEEGRLRSSISAHGVRSPVLAFISPTYGRAIIDGLNRSRLALALDKSVMVLNLGNLPDAQAKELADQLNRARRHLSLEEQQAQRTERVHRVVAARVDEKKSFRAIAKTEEVSVTQVREDLKSATVQGCTVTLPTTIEGLDGISRPASRPQPKRRRSITAQAHRLAEALHHAVKAVIASTQHRARLAVLASERGCPLAEETTKRKNGTTATVTVLPPLQLVRAILRDLGAPVASV